LTSARIQRQWPQIGTLTSISLTRDGHGDWGGRVTNAVLTGSAGSVTVSGDDVRYLMGDQGRSTWFQLTKAAGTG
jgi:stage II sporulation protein D